jgi:hypothetical protein
MTQSLQQTWGSKWISELEGISSVGSIGKIKARMNVPSSSCFVALGREFDGKAEEVKEYVLWFGPKKKFLAPAIVPLALVDVKGCSMLVYSYDEIHPDSSLRGDAVRNVGMADPTSRQWNGLDCKKGSTGVLS